MSSAAVAARVGSHVAPDACALEARDLGRMDRGDNDLRRPHKGGPSRRASTICRETFSCMTRKGLQGLDISSERRCGCIFCKVSASAEVTAAHSHGCTKARKSARLMSESLAAASRRIARSPVTWSGFSIASPCGARTASWSAGGGTPMLRANASCSFPTTPAETKMPRCPIRSWTVRTNLSAVLPDLLVGVVEIGHPVERLLRRGHVVALRAEDGGDMRFFINRAPDGT